MAGPVLVRVGEKLDHSFDWSDWLTAGDTISTRQWTITPTGPTLSNDTGQVVVAEDWTSGKVYQLAEDVVTANGLSGKREIVIRVR